MEGFEGHFYYIEIPEIMKSGLSDAGKTKSRENLCLCVRTVRAVTLDTPRPHKYNLK